MKGTILREQKRISKYIFEKYIEATELVIADLNESIISVNFDSIGLDYIRYLPNSHSSDRVKILDLDETSPLIESHVMLDASKTDELQLNYVICMGDRKRERLRIVEKQWVRCETCKQYLCPECLELFFGDAGVGQCPSYILGNPEHIISIKSK